MSNTKKVVIIGAGPAGLTAAYELLSKDGNLDVTIIEQSEYFGGISRTVNYKGNRIDIGGHRFFSKSDRVMDWWLNILPLAKDEKRALTLSYQNKKHFFEPKKIAENTDQEAVMMVRERKSRIYFNRNFFDYPIKLSLDTIKKLGLLHTIKIGLSYLYISFFPIKDEKNLEQFFINRFGKVLYKTFFKSYTEKVWGVSCQEISAEWGAQRIKGLSITKSLLHFFKSVFLKKSQDINQKTTETSLIAYFLYPKYGPGQMWETVAKKIEAMGAKIILNAEVIGLKNESDKITQLTYQLSNGASETVFADVFISTMAIKDLVSAFANIAPAPIAAISNNLMYRDFLTVGVLLKSFKNQMLKDNWIYIQEPDVKVGRLQIFNNWSPYMVANPAHTWIGMEYFCFEGDELWQKDDKSMQEFALEELIKLNLVDKSMFIDAVVIKMPKTYPAYFGVYNQFPILQAYLDRYQNLFLIGRNGMHKYNNQDHSMLTAMEAATQIIDGNVNKERIWAINSEQDYHESK